MASDWEFKPTVRDRLVDEDKARPELPGETAVREKDEALNRRYSVGPQSKMPESSAPPTEAAAAQPAGVSALSTGPSAGGGYFADARAVGEETDEQRALLRAGNVEYQKGIEQSAGLAQESAWRQAQEYEDMRQEQLTRAAEAERTRAEAQAAQTDARAQLADAMESYKYAEPEKYEALQATMRDPMASEKTKQMARAQMSRLEKDAFDPSRFLGEEPWKKALGGIALAIGAGLGGMAAGLTGNSAGLNAVMGAIQQGREQEKARLGEKKAESQRKQSFYQDLLQRFEGDEARADKAYEAASLRAVENKIQRMAAENRGTEAGARAEELLGQVKLKAEEADVAQAQFGTKQQMELRARGRDANNAQRNAQMQANATVQAAKVKAAGQAGGGVPGMQLAGDVTPDKREVEKVRTARGEVASTIKQIDDLIAYVEGKDGEGGVGGEIYGGSENAKVAAGKLSNIHTALKGEGLQALGVLAGADLDILTAQTGDDPTTVNPVKRAANMAALRDLKKRLVTDFKLKSRQHGLIETELGK